MMLGSGEFFAVETVHLTQVVAAAVAVAVVRIVLSMQIAVVAVYFAELM